MSSTAEGDILWLSLTCHIAVDAFEQSKELLGL
jgi:hypothetical protein